MHDEVFIPWRELVSIMYDRDLDNRDYRIVKVMYTTDCTKRYVISEKNGMFFYELELIERFDDEDWRYICNVEGALPAQWIPFHNDNRKSLFGSLDELMNDLVKEPEYIKYFS